VPLRPLPPIARALALSLVVGVAALTAGCGGKDEGAGSTEAAETAASTPLETTEQTGQATCAEVDLPPFGEEGRESPPTERLDPDTTYRLVFATSCGTFVVTLDQAAAPTTSASLVSLARGGYFDGTVFHRIVPGFVIQGGDPTQSGSGGPGYSTRDEPAADAAYVKGVVAMAKTLEEPPGTAGSQFFIVTGDDIGLPPEYAIVGTVTDGLAVVEEIDRQGDAATEQPTIPVVIDSVAVEET
jgi:cyclophilin family peptidyl-prolyl cis-trans isomerase